MLAYSRFSFLLVEIVNAHMASSGFHHSLSQGLSQLTNESLKHFFLVHEKGELLFRLSLVGLRSRKDGRELKEVTNHEHHESSDG